VGMEKVIDKVILWGCSIGYGLNADKDKIFGQRVADELGVPFINLSINGAGNIVGANIILNKPIDFFKNALVLFQTTYFERQIDKDIIANPFYGNRFYKEVNSSSFRVDEFKREYGIKEEELRINDWVGYYTEYENFYNRKYWKYKTDFDHIKWVSYLKELFKQNSYHLYLVHSWFKKNDIQHLFFDIPVPIVGYKLNYKDYTFSDFIFFSKATIRFLTENGDKKNSFYQTFKNENFFFIDEIDEKNRVTDILIETIYTGPVNSGSDTTIWKEFLKSDRPYGTPDNSHPNENGHRKVYQILMENIKRKILTK
jgi:hypothetical protein